MQNFAEISNNKSKSKKKDWIYQILFKKILLLDLLYYKIKINPIKVLN